MKVLIENFSVDLKIFYLKTFDEPKLTKSSCKASQELLRVNKKLFSRRIKLK